MKKVPVLLLCFLFSTGSFSQKLSQVILAANGNLSSIGFLTDQGVTLNISPEGNVLEWGIPDEQGRIAYYPGKLQPYMGRVDYYGAEADEAVRGKVKSIGTCTVTYFASYENKSQQGKVKTIGTIALNYYDDYTNETFKGKLKSAGAVLLTFYSSFDNEAFKGKLKTVAGTSLTYYSSFDDKIFKGKIKSIGNYNYGWYSSFDRKEYQGAMKTGSQIQLVNGVNFILKYY
jgi:hypothetical protein